LKQQKLILIGIAAVVILAYFFLDISGSLFGVIEEKFSPVNWNEVIKRNIVKNSVPITILEQTNGNCKVKAVEFYLIIDHEYFIKSEQLANQLKYDRDNATLVIPCDELKGEKSRLNVWYVLQESPVHSEKYEYFITEWEESK